MPYHPTVLLYFQKERIFPCNHNTTIKIRKLTHITPSDPIQFSLIVPIMLYKDTVQNHMLP